MTIDLEAEKRSTDQQAEEPSAAAPAQGARAEGGGAQRGAAGTVAPPPTVAPRSGWTAIGFALIGAIVVGVTLYLLMFTDLLPAPGGEDSDTVREELAALEAELDGLRAALSDQGDAVNEALGNVPQIDLTPLEQRVAALETQVGGLADIEATFADLTQTAGDLAADIEAEGAARAELAGELDELRRQSVAVAAAGGDPDAAAELGAEINALADRVAGIEAGASNAALTTLQEEVATIGERLTALEAAAPEDVLALREELDALTAQMQALADRTEALATTADALAADAGDRGRAELAARSLAIANIQNALDRGDAFDGGIDLLEELGVSAEALQDLRTASETGVASVAALQGAFPETADAILTASTGTDADANFLQRLFDNARNAVVVEPTTPVAGDDPPAIVSRMRAAVDAGDFATALDERAALPPEGLDASAGWAAQAEARVAAEDALSELERSLAGGVSE